MGVFVARLDRSERNHQRCVDMFSAFQGQLLTTEPVLTETVYLLGPSVNAQRKGIDFILQGGATLVPQSLASLTRASALMKKYSDTPMDLADATLVVLAEETGILEVLTLDVRGFSVYRTKNRKAFNRLP